MGGHSYEKPASTYAPRLLPPRQKESGGSWLNLDDDLALDLDLLFTLDLCACVQGIDEELLAANQVAWLQAIGAYMQPISKRHTICFYVLDDHVEMLWREQQLRLISYFERQFGGEQCFATAHELRISKERLVEALRRSCELNNGDWQVAIANALAGLRAIDDRHGVCRARRAGAWQAALEPDCSIQSHNDITIWRDNHPLFDNLWALELISIPQHSDSHGLAVENLGGVHLNDPHTLEGRALEIALRGNTTMASNNGEQAFECEDASIYLTPLREGWGGCFCFSYQSAVLIKKERPPRLHRMAPG